MLYHERTGFALGDPASSPFPESYKSDASARRRALEGLLLSASGWRKVFADGEESFSEALAPADAELAAAMGRAYADFLLLKSGKKRPAAALGLDSRPTGPAIAELLLRSFIAAGLEVRYCFILPAPEIMAYVKTTPEMDGFAYVSASHNPIGHNGVKFGLRGGVIGGKDSSDLIGNYRKLLADEAAMEETFRRVRGVSPEEVERLFSETAKWKTASERAYESFTRRVVADREDLPGQTEFFDRLRSGIADRGCGIVAELNGSARTLGIDRRIFEGLGVRLKLVNGEPRKIVHRIVPEGESLAPCRRELEKIHSEDPRFFLGYVPDNDGDRGNLVYFDETSKEARIIEAQEVFALACVAELSCLVSEGRPESDGSGKTRCVVAVNDPTSLRIDRIARTFGAEVVRAEVGEANVVALAKKHRDEGAVVRILGEGSNGGNITHPAEVRDPLNTIFAILKLLYLEPSRGRPSPREVWFRRIGLPELTEKAPDLGTLIATLPPFLTLSAYEPDALLKIKTQDHGLLKARYEEVFLREWAKRKDDLAVRFGLFSWEEINYEGIVARSGLGKSFRTGAERGGLTVLLKDSAETARAFLWMRGSGTEPVFRILVDAEGRDPELRSYLLDWHRSMIFEADGGT